MFIYSVLGRRNSVYIVNSVCLHKPHHIFVLGNALLSADPLFRDAVGLGRLFVYSVNIPYILDILVPALVPCAQLLC